MPIKDLRNTNEISKVAHREQEPIFITKNEYNDLVVMSSELYDKFVKINKLIKPFLNLNRKLLTEQSRLMLKMFFKNWRRNNIKKKFTRKQLKN